MEASIYLGTHVVAWLYAGADERMSPAARAALQDADDRRISPPRDPFDRLIVAHATLHDAPLVTQDDALHGRCPRRVW